MKRTAVIAGNALVFGLQRTSLPQIAARCLALAQDRRNRDVGRSGVDQLAFILAGEIAGLREVAIGAELPELRLAQINTNQRESSIFKAIEL
jgi:hypothetical protein